MHELSICRSIAGIVTRHAAGRPVRAVHLQLGHLRQVVPDTLTYCWTLVTADTPLDGAALDVEHVPATIRCAPCGATTTITAPVLVCGTCGGTDVAVVTGEEFLLTTLDLAEA